MYAVYVCSFILSTLEVSACLMINVVDVLKGVFLAYYNNCSIRGILMACNEVQLHINVCIEP